MRIVHSCILELREYKGRRIVCRLKFKESSDECFDSEVHFHWLNTSDWKTFDTQLCKTIDELERGVLEEICFQLNDEIDVTVSISSKSVGKIFKILGLECVENKYCHVSLNCLFHRHSGKISSSDICKGLPNFQKLDKNVGSKIGSSNSICSLAERNIPEQKNIFSSSSSKVRDYNNSARKLNEFKNTNPGSEVKKSTKTKEEDIDDLSILGGKKKHVQIQVQSTNANNNVEYLNNKKDKASSKNHTLVKKKVSEDDKIDLQKYVSTSQKIEEYDTQRKKLRSKRMSPERQKNSRGVIDKYKACFNSNDENNDFIKENESESKWLSKKQPEELVVTKKKSKIIKFPREKWDRGCESISFEDLDCQHRQNEQIKVNERIESLLECKTQVPKKVNILTLNNMGSDDIINTFPKYKSQLDAIFIELRSKPKVSGYNGINHYSVIELIDNEKQLKMMHKLGEVYEKDGDGISLYPMLFANALMPEWLVHLFKDKYRFSYSEAVDHLQKQQLYMQYLDTDDHF